MNLWPLPNHILLEMLLGAVSIAIVLKLLERCRAEAKGRDAGKRLDFLDFVKGASILSMILIHVSNKAPAGKVLNDFIWFGVPLFVFSSGYLLMRRYEGKLGLADYFRKTFFRVVLPYLIVCLVLHMANRGWTVNLGELLLDWVFGRLNGYNLYFIPVIIQFYLLFPLLRKYGDRLLAPAGMLALFLLSVAMNYADSLLRAPLWNSNLPELVFFGRYAFYFAFGAYLSGMDFEALPARRSSYALLALLAGIAALVALSSSLYFGYLFPLFWLFAIHLAYLGMKRIGLGRAIAAIESLGVYALAIYLFHTPIIDAFAPLASQAFSGWALYTVLCTAVAVSSWAFGAAFMGCYGFALKRLALNQ